MAGNGKVLVRLHHGWEGDTLVSYDGPSRWPTHRNIWQGSYDVWFCEQDRIDAVEIPKAKMKAAEESGLIESELRTYNKYEYTVWKLTERGKSLLGD